MKNRLLFLVLTVVLSIFAVLLCQTTNSEATGAPSDNTTIPNFNIDDQAQDEIKPLVHYVLLEPSAQSDNTTPNVITKFIGVSERENFQVTADENWYLDVDVNLPGWLYIYEYFPASANVEGKWIAYKWQLLQSGVWRLGPFIPGDDELEGQHICRTWFYSEGQWARENPDAEQNNLIYWTYSRGQPAEQPSIEISPQPTPTPVKEATLSDQLQRLIDEPLTLIIGPPVLVIIILFGLYMFWRYRRQKKNQDSLLLDKAELEHSSPTLPSGITRAKIALPNGMEIQLTDSKAIGRGNLARALGLDELGLISRRHFEIKYDSEQFYIEDLDSANGTMLNGTDISGKGAVILNNDDVIEPANTIRLKFHIL